MKRKNRWALLLALFCVLTLAACGSTDGDGPAPEPGVTTLIYANLTEGGVDLRAVNKFNLSHRERGVQIEVRDYFDEDGRSGKDRLLTEMAVGKVPDIIDLGGSSDGLPYQQMARKGYLEDLWPYIENDPMLGREAVWEAPLRAAEVDGGLYTIFESVRLRTLVGAESLVGYRYSWTLADLQEAFTHMPEESTVLNYYYTKSDIFSYVFSMSLGSYVDWETGTCSFDSEQFRAALEFVNSFPDEFHGFDFEDGEKKVEEEWLDRVRHGEQLLFTQYILGYRYMQVMDALLGRGGRAVPVGYPTEDSTVGSAFEVWGRKLAMSSTCQDKEAAWEFIRQIILPQYRKKEQAVNAGAGLPINLSDFDMIKQTQRQPPSGVTMYYSILSANGPSLKSRRPTAEEIERFEDFIDHVDKIDLYDTELYDIVWEVCGPYFAGDKTLDDTVQMLNNRVGLYLNEQK